MVPQQPTPEQQPPPPASPPEDEATEEPKETRRERRRRKREERGAKRGRGKIDLLIGIPLGLILGLGIITAFVFLGSEDTIDAPRLNDVPGSQSPRAGGIPVATVPGPGEAPGTPTQVTGTAGQVVRVQLATTTPVDLQLLSTRSGGPLPIRTLSGSPEQVLTFTFPRPGRYALALAGGAGSLANFVISG